LVIKGTMLLTAAYHFSYELKKVMRVYDIDDDITTIFLFDLLNLIYYQN